ncbi:MAG: alpha/beta fold hydrolase [Meiothermus sp.]|uniref:alpha/beta hydrolase family protein n=2 Tax=Meiothermus sp. TaxID=1955249 RepID=UPI0025DBC09C|nr:alpha/beta fold hydrolase [Meiothermus sp.]MCS7195083.1 alpha/beta fold hydrolase [Meiothermus sp.]MDW8092044.1 alpha/beta fold hydrolase [Meiothermus sp.]MDW8482672.1 alpha/beta fold hydrolase [Meiothermus sp.]
MLRWCWWMGSLWALSLGLSQPLTIDQLAQARYGGGTLSVERVLEQTQGFTRYLVRYPSQGLRMYGFMNVPNGNGRFPVVILIHGYVNPSTYRTLTYTTRYADYLARSGFIVLHPNLRGHGLSEGQPEGSPWRILYAQEILDLAAIVRAQAGRGALERALPRIGLMGHSMGGGVAQRVAVVDRQIRAVLLYSSMHGDDLKNARQICHVFTNGARGCEEARNPPPNLAQISPIYHFHRLRAQVQVHHGTRDAQTPYAWAEEICAALRENRVSHRCFTYPGAGHTFRGQDYTLLMQRAAAFFRAALN